MSKARPGYNRTHPILINSEMIPISRGGAAGQRERNGISRDNEHEERREPYEEKLAEEKMGGGMAEEM